MRNLTCIAILVCLAGVAAGCGTYTLKGKVVEGVDSDMLVVGADDPRLAEPGVAQVAITIHRDPDSLAREIVARDSSTSDGTFAIELPVFGAGWMDERWLLEATRSNYRNATRTLRLPRNSNRNRLLIIIAPGRSTPSEHRDDLWEEYRQYR